jgi:hypothetical protein
MRTHGITRRNDPRIPIYLSMLMYDYPETVRPLRRRDKLLTAAFTAVGRVLRMSTRT